MNLNIIKLNEMKIFMIFKNSDLVIFQSPFKAKLFKKYNNDIFVDGTFISLLNLVNKCLLLELTLKN